MKRLHHALIGLKQLWLCLTVSALLSGCAGLKPFPVERLWEYSPADHVCGEYKIVSYQSLKYAWVRDVPLEQCPAIFGFKHTDIPKVLNWGRDAQKYAKDHCH